MRGESMYEGEGDEALHGLPMYARHSASEVGRHDGE